MCDGPKLAAIDYALGAQMGYTTANSVEIPSFTRLAEPRTARSPNTGR